MRKWRERILILDKTVLESKGQEHRSFDWVLINEKYVHSKNIAYNFDGVHIEHGHMHEAANRLDPKKFFF